MQGREHKTYKGVAMTKEIAEQKKRTIDIPHRRYRKTVEGYRWEDVDQPPSLSSRILRERTAKHTREIQETKEQDR